MSEHPARLDGLPASALIGVVHLEPLPGTPRSRLSLEQIIGLALQDAAAYADGGADGLIVENFGDVPFYPFQVEPHTVAAMALAVRAVLDRVALPVGVNVLRNDALAAVGIAEMAGGSFVRINVHSGAMLTDQGLIEGRADQTLRYRRQLGGSVQIWADVLVKHASPLGTLSIEDAAEDAVLRGLADAVIVTGSATGRPAAAEDLSRVRRALPEVPVLVGSGVDPASIRGPLAQASGYIVGTWAKAEGRTQNRVDATRVRQLAAAVRELRARRS